MIFALDENFPKTALEVLSGRGHTVVDVRGTEFEGGADRAIFEFAQRNGAVLLSTDRDFFHTVPHLYSQHHGVIVVALRQPSRERILSRLVWLLDHLPVSAMENTVIQIRDRTYALIPPPEAER